MSLKKLPSLSLPNLFRYDFIARQYNVLLNDTEVQKNTSNCPLLSRREQACLTFDQITG